MKVKRSCEHLPSTPNLMHRYNISGMKRVWSEDKQMYIFSAIRNNFWCLPCCEVWYEKVNDNLKELGKNSKKEAFDRAGDPREKIKSFSSSEDLKKHIKAVHIFSKQKYQIVCPMQGCNETDVDVQYHMKVLHGVDEDDDENCLQNYCREPDSKNGICGCRFHVNNDCDEDILPCQSRHHLRHHGLGLWPLRDAESVYRRIPDILNPWE